MTEVVLADELGDAAEAKAEGFSGALGLGDVLNGFQDKLDDFPAVPD